MEKIDEHGTKLYNILNCKTGKIATQQTSNLKKYEHDNLDNPCFLMLRQITKTL